MAANKDAVVLNMLQNHYPATFVASHPTTLACDLLTTLRHKLLLADDATHWDVQHARLNINLHDIVTSVITDQVHSFAAFEQSVGMA